MICCAGEAPFWASRAAKDPQWERERATEASRGMIVFKLPWCHLYSLHLLNVPPPPISLWVICFFRMRELVRKKRRPRGERRMTLRRRKLSPASILGATCRSWWARGGFIVGFSQRLKYRYLKCEGWWPEIFFITFIHRQKSGVARGRQRERRRRRFWVKDAKLWTSRTWTRKDSSRWKNVVLLYHK